MRRYFADMNPTLRGFLNIAVIVLAIIILNFFISGAGFLIFPG